MANDATRAWALGVPHPKKGWGWRQPGFSESNDFAFKRGPLCSGWFAPVTARRSENNYMKLRFGKSFPEKGPSLDFNCSNTLATNWLLTVKQANILRSTVTMRDGVEKRGLHT